MILGLHDYVPEDVDQDADEQDDDGDNAFHGCIPSASG